MGMRAGRGLVVAVMVTLGVGVSALPAAAREVRGTATVRLEATVLEVGGSRATGTAVFEGTTDATASIADGIDEDVSYVVSGEGALVLRGHRRDDGSFVVNKVKVTFSGLFDGDEVDGRGVAKLATPRVLAAAALPDGVGSDAAEFVFHLEGRGTLQFHGSSTEGTGI